MTYFLPFQNTFYNIEHVRQYIIKNKIKAFDAYHIENYGKLYKAYVQSEYTLNASEIEEYTDCIRFSENQIITYDELISKI